jgi:hypothetical protein
VSDIFEIPSRISSAFHPVWGSGVDLAQAYLINVDYYLAFLCLTNIDLFMLSKDVWFCVYFVHKKVCTCGTWGFSISQYILVLRPYERGMA